MTPVAFQWLGRIDYAEALRIQEEFVSQVADGTSQETVLLLEHNAVYTIGRTRDRSSLGTAENLPHPVFETNRGGQATFHGPGQLVGYPILRIGSRGRDLHAYLRFLEEVIIGICDSMGICAGRRDGLTGVWVEERKIASIGVGLRRWVSMHGFALNVGADLSAFEAITPCGIAGVRMTSLSRECGREVSVADAAAACTELFPRRLESDLPVTGALL